MPWKVFGEPALEEHHVDNRTQAVGGGVRGASRAKRGRSHVRSFVGRLLAILVLPVLTAGVVVGYQAWETGVRDIESSEQLRLRAVVTTLALQIDGRRHELLTLAHPAMGDVTAWADADPEVRALRQLLCDAADANALSSPVYTMRLRDSHRAAVMSDPTHVHPEAMEFILSSAESPYWRHTYQYLPSMAPALFDAKTATSGIYRDQHGSWVSAYAPVKDAHDLVVAILEADTPVDAIVSTFLGRMERRAVGVSAVFLVSVVVVIVLLVRLRKSERCVRVAAEEGSRAKSEFLANMSHEIRTPMTAIMGYADLLYEDQQRDGAPPRKLEPLRIIRQSGRHLLTLIDDILDLSKVESRKLVVEKNRCSLVQLVSGVQSLMMVRATEKGIGFEVRFDTPVPKFVETDAARLRQILVNLVGNAIKFTQRGKVTLAVSLERRNGKPHLQFDVRDTGIGLTPKQERNLFQPFNQADASTTRRFGGTGLGLLISKRLAQLLDGDVLLVESAPGEGSCFRAVVGLDGLPNVAMIENPPESNRRDDEQDRQLRQPLASISGRILLAEDGVANKKLITLILEKAGAIVTAVEDGEQAVSAATEAVNRGQPFDLIILDMQMPVLDGYRAAGVLRDRGFTCPILALTAHAMPGDRQKCLDAGCDAYQTKPVARRRFIQRVGQLLREQVAV